MIENELKYVLKLDTFQAVKAALGEPMLFKQGYLPGNGRIRSTGKTCYFTYKLGVGEVLFEIEKEITQYEFDSLWPHTESRLEKYRFTTHLDVVQWDIDFFLDPEHYIYFAMAEAEMPEDMKEPPEILSLLIPYIIYAVPRVLSATYSSRRIANPDIASTLMERLSEAIAE